MTDARPAHGRSGDDPQLQDSQQRAFEDAAAKRLVRRVLQQWTLIVACAVVAALAAYGASASRTKQYEATAKVKLESFDLLGAFLSDQLQISDVDPERQSATNAELLQLPRVRAQTAEELGGRITTGELAKQTTVTASPDTDIVSIVVRNPDPLLAAQAANGTVRSFVAIREQATREQLNRAKSKVRAQIKSLPEGSANRAQLEQRLEQIGSAGSLATSGVDPVQAASPPRAAVAPRPKRDAILGLIAGGLLGLGIALLRARLDDRIRDTDELSELWPLPVVGLVPETGGLDAIGRGLPAPQLVEAFALARTNLRYLHVGGDVRSIVVTSALENEGKSTVAWNLAVASAMAESRVLVIEADLRRPVLSQRLGLSSKEGFSEVLAGLTSAESVISTVEVLDQARGVKASVDVLPAGLVPPSPIALLERPITGEVIRRLAANYDLVIVDTPPATVVADALVTLEHVDGAVVVSRLTRVTRSSYRRLRDQISGGGKPVVGQIVNGGASSKDYGYQSYYTQGDGPAGGKGRGTKPAEPLPEKTA